MRQQGRKRQSRKPAAPDWGLALIALLAAAGLAPAGLAPAEAAPAAPVIDRPSAGWAGNDEPIEVAGSAGGDAIAVRVYEGGALLGETGPVGGRWSIDVSLAEGTHTIHARARDVTGALGPASAPLTFTLDRTPPAVPSVDVPTEGSVLSFSAVTIEGAGDPGTHVGIRLDGGPETLRAVRPDGSWSLAASLTDAPHEVVARGVDAAGNLSLPSAPRRFRVDLLAPPAPLLDLPGDGARVRPPVTLAGRSEPGASVEVSAGSVIGTVIADGSGNWTLAHPFGEGSHLVSARARDGAGHVGPAATMSFTVDATAPAPPTLTSPPEGSVVAGEVRVAGTAEPGSGIEILAGPWLVAQTAAGPSGSWFVWWRAGSGTQSIQARARDAAGNRSARTPVRTFLVDNQPPTVRISTPDNSLFTPSQTPSFVGTAGDDLGVVLVELQFWDALGRLALVRTATCACADRPITWVAHQGMPTGRYTLVATAIDPAGTRSLPSTIRYVDL